MTSMVYYTQNALSYVYRATVFGFNNYVLQIQTYCWHSIKSAHTNYFDDKYRHATVMIGHLRDTATITTWNYGRPHTHYRTRKPGRRCMLFNIKWHRLIWKDRDFWLTINWSGRNRRLSPAAPFCSGQQRKFMAATTPCYHGGYVPWQRQVTPNPPASPETLWTVVPGTPTK
jgi:hypothetical protein